MRFPLLAILLLLPCLAAAQMYRWVDADGKVHYSDRVPSSSAKDLQKIPMSAGKASSANLPYALQQAVANFPVTLYTSEACKETCSQARELLGKRGVPYSEVNVAYESDLAQLKKLTGGNAVPVLVVGRDVYEGFESGQYQRALDTAQYPSSSLLPSGVQARQPVAKVVQKAVPAATDPEGRPTKAPQKPTDTTAPSTNSTK